MDSTRGTPEDEVLVVSTPTRCLAIGVLVFLYWTAAFASAVADKILIFKHGLPPQAWWHVPWLVEPGYQVGRPVLGMLEDFPGWRLGASMGWPFYGAVLLVAAASMGTGAWLFATLVAGWWQRRHGPLPAHPERSR
jgi:hypothetical protein